MSIFTSNHYCPIPIRERVPGEVGTRLARRMARRACRKAVRKETQMDLLETRPAKTMKGWGITIPVGEDLMVDEPEHREWDYDYFRATPDSADYWLYEAFIGLDAEEAEHMAQAYQQVLARREAKAKASLGYKPLTERLCVTLN